MNNEENKAKPIIEGDDKPTGGKWTLGDELLDREFRMRERAYKILEKQRNKENS